MVTFFSGVADQELWRQAGCLFASYTVNPVLSSLPVIYIQALGTTAILGLSPVMDARITIVTF